MLAETLLEMLPETTWDCGDCVLEWDCFWDFS
jgi:hypothetical protein